MKPLSIRIGSWPLVWAIGVFAADRISKLVAMTINTPVLPRPQKGFYFFLNETFAFGIPGGNRLATIVSTLVILALVWYLVLHYSRMSTAAKAAYVLILAGATSNLFDRFTLGGTADWYILGPWTINLADLAILLGVILLLIKSPGSRRL